MPLSCIWLLLMKQFMPAYYGFVIQNIGGWRNRNISSTPRDGYTSSTDCTVDEFDQEQAIKI